MKNRIEDLRNHLFAAIEGLMDEDNPMAIDRAKAVADVAQVIINSAKVEVDYLKSLEHVPANVKGTGFLEKQNKLHGVSGGKQSPACNAALPSAADNANATN